MQMQHQGDDIDDSVSHFLNTSLLGGVAESPGAHAGSMTHSPARSSSLSSSPFKSPGLLHGSHNSLAPSQYPLGSAYAHLSGYPFLPTSTNYDYTAIAPMSAGLRPRSAADHPVDGLDRQHPLGSGYFDSYPPDRLPPFHNHNQSHNYNSSSRNSGYIFDPPATRVLVSGSAPFLTLAVPGSGVPLLGSDLQSDTASTSTSSPYIPMGYLDHSALHAHGGILPESASEHSTAMVFPSHHPASDEVFYAPSDLYLADSTGGALQQPQREDMAQEAFTLPGIPSAEEAFLSHLNDTPSGIDPAVISKVDDPLPGDPRRDLLLLSSGFQTPLELPSSSDFGSDDLEIEHTLYNAHIGTRSPSGSDSSRSSQKRARGKPDYFSPASTVMGSTEWSSVMSNKRQRLDLIEEEHDTPVPSGSRRTRARRLSNAGPSFRNDDEDDVFESGGDDSDLYIPSRSPSPNHPRLYLPSSSPPASEGEEQTPMPAKVRPGRRRRGGKAKGSAAKALAMITQAQKEELLQQLSDQGYNEHVTECGSNLAYMMRGSNEDYEGGSSRGGRSVSPAPIPNLTKKSRGRKVPYVAAVRGGTGIGEGIPLSGATGGVMPLSQNGRIRGKPARKAISGTGGRRGRGGRGGRAGRGGAGESRLEYLEMRGLMDQAASPPPQSVQEPSGEERSFVCTIPGCGKCFIRGEHLKRHVRSIHTEDKPYMCPYKGCGKSFSRRDNLGQHVRIHLND